VVVPSTSAIAAIAVDDTDVYWVEVGTGPPSPSGIVARCSKTACTASTVLATGLTEPFGIALTPSLVLYTDLDGVHACEKASCSPALIAPATLATELAVDATHVFFRAGAGIFSCPLGGCSAPNLLAPSGTSNYLAVAVDDTDVYWVATGDTGGMPSGQVLACPKAGCTGSPRVVVPDVPSPYGLAVDVSSVYVTSGQTSADGAGAIATCGKKQHCLVPQMFVGSLDHPIAVTVDSTTVYWVDQGTMAGSFTDGDVGACPKSGCPTGPTFLAKGQQTPGAITTDDACIYWALSPPGVGTGAILRAPK
jgi:hypothetical protein